ncbi:MAG TPA: hypothetical protein VFW75_01065, partial [Acetobacteraceae bacterium]|nr:hypothetical protein [Acetobacteraceae bacterium]
AEPQLSHFICHQHRPEFVWVPAWLEHPNGVAGITRITYATSDPLAIRSRFAGIWGDQAITPADGGFRVETAGGSFVVLDRCAARARFAGVTMPVGWEDGPCGIAIGLRAPDPARVTEQLAGSGVPFHATDGSILVGPPHAGNVILEFGG